MRAKNKSVVSIRPSDYSTTCMEFSVSKLSASYDKNPVLCDISFSLQQGEFVCLCGPNGAGKSTLLSVMANVPDASLKVNGEIRWVRYDASENMVVEYAEKRRVSKPPRRKMARLIAYLQQNEYSEWNFTVHDYVLQGRYAWTKPSLFGAGPADYTAADFEIVDEVLKELSLSDFSDRHIHELSGGEFQKIRLARAFAQTPHFLLLDEPAANLDYVYEPHLMALLRDTSHKKDLGILAAVHDINLAARFADKVLLLPPKKSVLYGTPSDIMTIENLKYTFGVDFECKETKSFQSLQ